MVYKQNTFLYPKIRFWDMSPSSRYVVEGFFCTIWSSLEPYIIDLSRFYEKNPKLIEIIFFAAPPGFPQGAPCPWAPHGADIILNTFIFSYILSFYSYILSFYSYILSFYSQILSFYSQILSFITKNIIFTVGFPPGKFFSPALPAKIFFRLHGRILADCFFFYIFYKIQ